VGRGILSAAERQSVHVLAQAVLADHVHVVISVRPDRAITPSGSIDRPRPHPRGYRECADLSGLSPKYRLTFQLSRRGGYIPPHDLR